MDKAAYERLMEIYAKARLLEGSELESFLSSECRTTPELSERVRRMLEDERRQEEETLGPSELATEYERDAATIVQVDDSKPIKGAGLTDQQIQDYEILAELGRGAMGVVYHARQTSLGRPVALKRIIAGQLADDAEIKRFRVEAESAATLDHPGIVPIYEIGEHDGQPFFSMGFIDGGSLSGRLKGGPLEPHEAARLTAEIADSIDYAHSKGIIHRDLKPANILLDEQGRTRVTDFGLAKRLDSASELTASGQILGTPSFMAPEQASGKIDEVKEPADVYALGAILYHMLCGHPPFQASSPIDTLIQVVEDDPIPPIQLSRNVPDDLNTICLKCLEKKPDRRYESARALQEDLNRFLKSQPIHARPKSAWVSISRWTKRHPALTVAMGMCVMFLVTVIGLSIGMAVQQTTAANRLRVEKAKTDQALEDLTDQIDETEKQRGLAEAGQKRAERALRTSEAQKLATMSQASQADYPQRAVLLAREAVEITERANEPVEPLAELALRDALANFDGFNLGSHEADVSTIRTSADGNWAISLSSNKGLLWKIGTSGSKHSCMPIEKSFGGFDDACFSPSSELLAVAGTTNFGMSDGEYYGNFAGNSVALYDPAAESPSQESIQLHTEYPAQRLALSPDGKRLFAWASSVMLAEQSWFFSWILDTSEVASSYQCIPHGGSISQMSIDSTGRWLITSATDGLIRVWDLQRPLTDPPMQTIDAEIGEIYEHRLTPDEKWLIACGNDTTYWSFSSGIDKESGVRIEGGACTVSDDSRWVATYSRKMFPQSPPIVRLVDLFSQDADIKELRMDRADQVLGVILLTDPSEIVVVQNTTAHKRWNIDQPAGAVELPPLQAETRIRKWLRVPDDNRVLFGHSDGLISSWTRNEEGDLIKQSEWIGHEGMVRSIERVSKDYSISSDVLGSIQLWPMDDTRSGSVAGDRPIVRRTSLTPDHVDSSKRVAFSSDGKWLVTSDGIFELSRQITKIINESGNTPIAQGFFNQDNTWLVTKSVGSGGRTQLWHLDDGGPVETEFVDRLRDLTFSHDGRFLFGSDEDSRIGFAKPAKVVVFSLHNNGKTTKHEFEPPHEPKVIGFVPNSGIMLTWGSTRENFNANGTIAAWDLTSAGTARKISECDAPCRPGIKPFLRTTSDGQWIVLIDLGLDLEVRVLERTDASKVSERGSFRINLPSMATSLDAVSHSEDSRWIAISLGQSQMILLDTKRMANEPDNALYRLTMPRSGTFRNPQFSPFSDDLLASFAVNETDETTRETLTCWRLFDGADFSQPIEICEIDPGTHYYLDKESASIIFRSDDAWNQITLGIESLLDFSNQRVQRGLTDEERKVYGVESLMGGN